MHKPFVIGISGASGSGKTTLGQNLVTCFSNKRYQSKLFSMDDYYWDSTDEHHIRDPITKQPNYDCKSSVNWTNLIRDVENHLAHTKSNNSQSIIIIEGILILNIKELTDLMDVQIFFKLDYETMIDRRKKRVYESADPSNYFVQYVWPMYLITLNEIELSNKNVVFFDGKLNPEEQLQTVQKLLKHTIHDYE